MLGDTYLTMHRWFKGFDPWTTKVTTIMVWVEMSDLPIEFYNPEAVMRIASRIGKPVRVDRATEAGARRKYARVCVEVDLSKRLLPKYKVEGVSYLIVYEGFHKICTKCEMYGTPTYLCKCDLPQVEDMMTNDTKQVHKVCDPSNGQVFGEWMMPKKKAWRRTKEVPNSVNKPQSTKPITQGNRFDVLNNNEDNVPTASPAISQGGKKQPATGLHIQPLVDVEKEGNKVSSEGMITGPINTSDKVCLSTNLMGPNGVNDELTIQAMQNPKQTGKSVISLDEAKHGLTKGVPTKADQKKPGKGGEKIQN
ncbi:hypothetical protein LINGRAHAP2_LOCUS2165 [Linum grandiflorum]